METKTCPHCNELAQRDWAYDVYDNMEAWTCTECGRTFHTYTDLEEGVDI